MPRFKVFEEPFLPVGTGGIFDAAVFVALCALIAGAAVANRYAGRRSRRCWRTGFQLAAVFVLFFAVAIRWCAFRRSLIGAFMIGVDDMTAFANLFLWVVLMFFAISLGRTFCGWVCPVGTIQEWGRWLTTPLRRAFGGGRAARAVGLTLLAAAALAGIATIWLTRPARFVLAEYPMAFWGIATIAAAMIVLAAPSQDRPMRLLRYSSAILAATIALLGLMITGPGCFIFKNELDYSSIIGTTLVVVAAIAVARTWCRYLCPFGAIFALVARRSLLSVQRTGAGCTGCGICRADCPSGARGLLFASEAEPGTPAGDPATVCGECFLCGRCVDRCPNAALTIVRRQPDEIA